MLDDTFNLLPKAELHVHLEGTISPSMAKILAAKNNITLPEDLFLSGDNSYSWAKKDTASDNLVSFLNAYDQIASLIKTPQDYSDITYDYLMKCAKEGSIYEEIIISADHGASVGINYKDMIDAIAIGVYAAHKDSDIEARLLSACVRHYGPENAIKVAKQTVEYPHHLVTAFHMAGDENAYTVDDFILAFEIAKNSGLEVSAHAGEVVGPDSIKDVKEKLQCKRYGHMVRIIEDPDFMNEMKVFGAVPEICVSSNLFMGAYKNYDEHPIRKIHSAGFKIALGSDDPPFFDTSIGKEYFLLKEHFNFTVLDLLEITQNSIKNAFVDDETKKRLLKKVDEYRVSLNKKL